MAERKRTSWRLTDENIAFLRLQQRRLAIEEGLGELSLNQVLNYLLFQWRKHTDPHFKPPTIEEIQPSPMGYVYVLGDGEGMFKIGCSRNPTNRRKDLQVGSGRVIATILSIPCPAIEMKSIEDSLHARFKSKYVRGEWFRLDEREIDWIRRSFQMGAEA